MLAAAAIARRLTSDLRAIGDRLGEFGRQVKGIVLQFPQNESLKGDDRFSLEVSQQMPQLASDVDSALEDQFTGPSGGLLAVAMGSPRVRDQFVAELLRLATLRAEQLSSSPALTAAVTLPAAMEGKSQSIDGVELPLVSCLGGSYAVLETRPNSTAVAWDANTSSVASLVGVGSQAVRCCEAWNLSLPRIALNLIDNRRECIEFAERVSSRCDIDWTPLRFAAPSPPVATGAVQVEASPTTAM
jgi:hypothetical protein